MVPLRHPWPPGLTESQHATAQVTRILSIVLCRSARDTTGSVFGAHGISWMSEFSLTEGIRGTWRPSSHPCVFLPETRRTYILPSVGREMTNKIIRKLAVANRRSGSGKTDAAERFLASYEEERPNAQAMVKATGRVTKVLSTVLSRTLHHASKNDGFECGSVGAFALKMKGFSLIFFVAD